ncbi:aspartic peptidase domain-containing protein, partial [Trichoderma sp. SZMC 28014]
MHFPLLMALTALGPAFRQVAALSIQLTERDRPAIVLASVEYRPVSDEFITQATTPLITISVGTPAQAVQVAVDLQRSSNSLLVPNIRKYEPIYVGGQQNCSDDNYCTLMGYFDPSRSSTFKNATDVNGASGSDSMSINGWPVDGFSMSLSSIFDSTYNVLGVAQQSNSFPFRLVDQGLINSPSFSLFGDPLLGSGYLLFGGVDQGIYEGPLQAFPFPGQIPGANGTVSVPIASVVVESSGNISTRHELDSAPAVLSTVDSHTFLPNNTVQKIYADLDITPTFVPDLNATIPYVDCARQHSENHTISLLFGNASISVPWNALVQSLGNNTCELAIYSYEPEKELGPGSQIQIGSIFLRYMYLVVDYDNMFAAVAPLHPNPTTGKFVEIGNGSRIPDADGNFPATITAYGVTPTPTKQALSTSSSRAVAIKPQEKALTFGFTGALLAVFYLI